MVFRGNLRKTLGLGEICLVAANAELGSIQLSRLDRGWVFGMLGQRPVARFAGYSLVHAFAFHIENVGVAALANLMSGISNRKCCNLGDGLAAIVAVLTKAAWHKESAYHQKQDKPDHEDGRQPEEMLRIFEILHRDKQFSLFVDIGARSQPAVFWVT